MPNGNAFNQRWIMEPKRQTVWGIPHATWFFAMGVGGALYLNRFLFGIDLGRILGMSAADILGMILISIGGLILIADLGQPLRFWKALRNPRTSWISVGAICDFIFMGAETLYVLPSLELGGARPFAALPTGDGSAIGLLLQVVAAIAAFIVIVYPGLVLASTTAIPFWNTTLIPLQFLAYAFTSALGLAVLAGVLGLSAGGLTLDTLVATGLMLAACLILIVAHLLNAANARRTALASAQILLRGDLKLSFWAGCLILGLAAPLLLVLFALGTGPSPTVGLALILAGILTLPGNYFAKYCVIRAGLYAPFL